MKATQLTHDWKWGEWWVEGLLLLKFFFRSAGWPNEGAVLAAQEVGKWWWSVTSYVFV